MVTSALTHETACHRASHPRGIELRCEAAGLLEERPLPPDAVARLGDWSARYRQIALRRQRVPLLDLGEEIFRWLDGASRFLERIVDVAPTPLVIEFGAAKQDASAAARALLDAPWEVLGDSQGPWALRPNGCTARSGASAERWNPRLRRRTG